MAADWRYMGSSSFWISSVHEVTKQHQSKVGRFIAVDACCQQKSPLSCTNAHNTFADARAARGSNRSNTEIASAVLTSGFSIKQKRRMEELFKTTDQCPDPIQAEVSGNYSTLEQHQIFAVVSWDWWKDSVWIWIPHGTCFPARLVRSE